MTTNANATARYSLLLNTSGSASNTVERSEVLASVLTLPTSSYHAYLVLRFSSLGIPVGSTISAVTLKIKLHSLLTDASSSVKASVYACAGTFACTYGTSAPFTNDYSLAASAVGVTAGAHEISLSNISSSLLNSQTFEVAFGRSSNSGYGYHFDMSSAATCYQLTCTYATPTGTLARYGALGEWKTCEIYYGADGLWKKCKGYYGLDGQWKQL